MDMGEGKAGIAQPDPCRERGGKQGTKEREGMKGKFQMLCALPHEIHRNRRAGCSHAHQEGWRKRNRKDRKEQE